MSATVLLLTVGTGQQALPEETLFEPFGKSLRAARCVRNILLPSRKTLPQAERIRERFGQEFELEISPLPGEGDENDADACFRHFDSVLTEVLASGVRAADVIADITRGTKAMSAALLLAAALHGAGRVRYLMAQQLDDRGAALPGHEAPKDIEPAFIHIRLALGMAESLFRAHGFRAVELLLEPLLPSGVGPHDAARRLVGAWLWAARFWGAWDRFDYSRAVELLDSPPPAPGAPGFLFPSPAQKEFLRRLASPLPAANGERVKHGRCLAADLLANAERRLAAGHSEEALVRLYRTLELMTRYRLFAHNLDSEKLNQNHPKARAWLAEQRERASGFRQPAPRSLGRRQAASLLAYVEAVHPASRGYGIAQRLLATEKWLGLSDGELRNGSILIHGLEASAPQAGSRLGAALAAVREFYREESPGNARLYECARYPLQC